METEKLFNAKVLAIALAVILVSVSSFFAWYIFTGKGFLSNSDDNYQAGWEAATAQVVADSNGLSLTGVNQVKKLWGVIGDVDGSTFSFRVNPGQIDLAEYDATQSVRKDPTKSPPEFFIVTRGTINDIPQGVSVQVTSDADLKTTKEFTVTEILYQALPRNGN